VSTWGEQLWDLLVLGRAVLVLYMAYPTSRGARVFYRRIRDYYAGGGGGITATPTADEQHHVKSE
jgi:hypothetical protein